VIPKQSQWSFKEAQEHKPQLRKLMQFKHDIVCANDSFDWDTFYHLSKKKSTWLS